MRREGVKHHFLGAQPEGPPARRLVHGPRVEAAGSAGRLLLSLIQAPGSGGSSAVLQAAGTCLGPFQGLPQ